MTRRRVRNGAGFGVAGLLVSRPAAALACPVCFGASGGPSADGVNLAVLALLGLTLAVLGGFAAFFVSLARRSRLAQEPPGSTLVTEGSMTRERGLPTTGT